jgi:polysaccharide biosynthesis transport protein
MKHFLLAWHRRIWIWILTGIPVLTGLATFYYALNRVDQYRSIAEILVTPEHLPGTPVLQGQNVTGENLASHTEAMKTKLICTMAAYKLLLHDMEERVPFRDFAPLSTELGSGLITAKLKSHLASFETLSSRDSITNEINYAMEMKGYNLAKWIANGNLSISPVKDSEIIRVESVSENPFLSAFVVNSLCTEYIQATRCIFWKTN